MNKILMAFFLFSSISTFAKVTCPLNLHELPGKVTIEKDLRGISITGFKSIGVPNGKYYCTPSHIDQQGDYKFARLNCSLKSVFIVGNISEGPDKNGQIATGLILITQEGQEFFKSGCIEK
jgi:hypothetical protein